MVIQSPFETPDAGAGGQAASGLGPALGSAQVVNLGALGSVPALPVGSVHAGGSDGVSMSILRGNASLGNTSEVGGPDGGNRSQLPSSGFSPNLSASAAPFQPNTISLAPLAPSAGTGVASHPGSMEGQGQGQGQGYAGMTGVTGGMGMGFNGGLGQTMGSMGMGMGMNSMGGVAGMGMGMGAQ